MLKVFSLSKCKFFFIFSLFVLLNYHVVYTDSLKVENGVFYSHNSFFMFRIPPIFNIDYIHFFGNFMEDKLHNDILRNYYLTTIYDNFNSIQIEFFKLLKPTEEMNDSIANIILQYNKYRFNSKHISSNIFDDCYLFFLYIEKNDTLQEDLIVGYVVYKLKNFIVSMSMSYPKQGTIYYFNGKNEKMPVYNEDTEEEILGILTSCLLSYKENIKLGNI